jgi:hypothetical protein
MTNDLMTDIDNLSQDKLMALIGQETDSGGDSTILSRLSINYDSEDADGNLIKRGLFKVDSQQHGVIYAEKVSFRPFFNTYQYKKYDEENEENNYKSVMFTSWTDAKPDTNGTESCGSIPRSMRDRLEIADKIEQDKITCFRNVFGLVTIKGKDSKGKEASLVNEPALYRVRGVNFLPIGEQLKSLSKRNKIMLNTVLEFFGTEKHTNGSVTYFVAKIKDSNKDVKFSEEDKKVFNMFKDHIKNENDYVKREYAEALKRKHKASTTADDLDDEILLEEMSA